MNNILIGKVGEKIVRDLLPKSIWLNELWEKCQSWDLEWRGLKIDVKTTTNKSKRGKAFKFGSQILDKNVVYVFVGIDGLKNYFWISQGKSVRWKKIKDSVPNLRIALLKIIS